MLRLCLLPFALLIAAQAAAPGFPDNEDLRHFRSLNNPLLSPDGKQVLIRVIDATADGAKSHLWLVDIAANVSRQLTYSPDADKAGELSPAWMPDGRAILFLAHRGEHTQLFRLPLDGGEAKPFDLKVAPPADASKLADALPPAKEVPKPEEKNDPLAIDVASFNVSPDGRTIALTANDPKTPGEKKQSDAKADAVWVNHELHQTRLYLLSVDTGKLMPVAIPDDVEQLSWSSDNSRLLAIASEPNGISDLHPAATAWLVTPNGPDHPVKLTGLPSTIQSADWTKTGNAVIFQAQAERDTPPGYRDVFEYDIGTHSMRNFTKSLSGSVGFQKVIPLTDESVLIPAGLGVTAATVQVSHDGRMRELHFPTPVMGSLNTNEKQTGWVFLGSSATQPATLYYAAALNQTPLVLNTPSLVPANNRTAVAKRISWKSDDFTIEGLLYLPAAASEKRVPLIVEVHGGPLGAYFDDYAPFVNFLVGQGWAVLRTNPRGSTNYGAAFAAANKNDLGGGDYRDIMAGVDYVLKTESIDPDKLALEGYSYGGEMAGFVEGKTTRFKAIVCEAPVIDQYSEYGTEGDSYYDRWYYGKPWEHPEDAWRQSPLAGVSHAKTPFLLLQGEADSTDPLGQAQEMYRALRQAGVPVELVTYPRENHGPLGRGIYGLPTAEPWHGFDARQRIVAFIQKAFKA